MAPTDGYHLVRKVILIVGYYGGLCVSEMLQLQFSDVSIDDEIKVHVNQSNSDPTGKTIFFIIPSLAEASTTTPCPASFVKQYINLVPNQNGRFFRNFNVKSERFSSQDMGINTLSAVPKVIAKWLQLDSADQFTGHCFRRTAATVAADEGMSIVNLKRQFAGEVTRLHKPICPTAKKFKAEVANNLTVSSTNLAFNADCKSHNKTIHLTNCEHITINF